MRPLYQAAFFGMFSLLFLIACGSTGPAGPPGDSGPPGANALTSSSAEPAGANCANGGTKVDYGLDTNANGVLDPSEVTGTTYVCNGSGQSALIKTTPEPGGNNCQYGGIRIDSGVDTNNNGVLDANEITNTTYACNTAPSGTPSVTEGIVANIKDGDVSTSTSNPITVRFTLKDSKGYPVDVKGVYSVNQAIQPKFGLAYFTKDTAGNVLPLKVFTQSTSAAADGGVTAPQPTTYNPLGTAAGHGTLVENGIGAGDYTYTFPSTATNPGPVAVAYDATKLSETHVVWIAVSRQTDMVYPTNGKHLLRRELALLLHPDRRHGDAARDRPQRELQKCHDKFRLETARPSLNAVHGGGRIDGTICNVCHNPERSSNPAADSAVFIHRIHNGQADAARQPVPRHRGHLPAGHPQLRRLPRRRRAGRADRHQPDQAACGSCHDYVDFTGTAAATCTDPVTRGANGLPSPASTSAASRPTTPCTDLPRPGGHRRLPRAGRSARSQQRQARRRRQRQHQRRLPAGGRLRPGGRGGHHLRRQERPDLDRHVGHPAVKRRRSPSS